MEYIFLVSSSRMWSIIKSLYLLTYIFFCVFIIVIIFFLLIFRVATPFLQNVSQLLMPSLVTGVNLEGKKIYFV